MRRGFSLREAAPKAMPFVAALAAATLLAGCYLFNTQVEKPLRSLQGQTLEAVTFPVRVAYREGKLYVAAADDNTRIQGIAVVDTGTKIIERYYSLPRAPRDFLFLPDGRIAVAGQFGLEHGPQPDQAMLSLIDPVAGTVDSFVQPLTPFLTDLRRVGDRVFALGTFECNARALYGNLRTPLWERTFPGNFSSGQCRFGLDSARLVLPGGYHYSPPSEEPRRPYIRVYALTGSSISESADSISLGDIGGTTIGEIAVWGDYAFVAILIPWELPDNWTPVNGFPPYEYEIAVVHLPSRTVEKIIPLEEADIGRSRVEDGIWYLWGKSVETIDLRTRTYGRVLVPRQAEEYRNIGDFVQTGPAEGYVLHQREAGQIRWIEKVAF